MFGGSFKRRRAAVSGRFYPGQATRLEETVSSCLGEIQSEPVLAVVAPHAGYTYSGATAGRVYGRIAVPERVVILCPNHTGRGAPLSVWSNGVWDIPFGSVPVDETFATALLDSDDRFQADTEAHLSEHAIEVQIPFLHARNAEISIVPIVVSVRSAEELIDLGRVLAQVIKGFDDPTLIVASNDMSHFVSSTQAEKLDGLALKQIENLNPRGLHEVVRENGISMCGVFPTTLTLAAAIELGATEAEVIDYTHSGQVTGDNSSVVAYAGVVIR